MIIEVYGTWGGGGVFALHWVLKETQAFENTESQSDLRYTLGESLGVGWGGEKQTSIVTIHVRNL